MAEIKFSQLTTAAQLTNDDIFALAQMQGGSLSSVKTSMIAVANYLNTQVQYTTAYNTQAKTTAGAINELKQLISLIPQFAIEVVEELPTEDISDTTIYLVPAEDPEVGNYYEEYIHVNDAWELVGTTAVDLSAYYTKLEVDGLLANKASVAEVALKENKTDMPTDVRTIIKGCKTPKNATITNGIAQFECIEENLVKGLKVSMNPIQDLHGYSNPWAGGAGKNKFQNTATTQTINGVTFTVNSDGTVLVNGTATGGDSRFTVGAYIAKAQSSQKLNGLPDSITNSNIVLGYQGYGIVNTVLRELNISRSAETDWNNDVYITVKDGITANNLVFKPMIRLSTETDPAFAPYSNICPISGRTEASVKRTGKNLFDKNAITDGSWLSTTTGEIETSSSTTNYVVSDFIPVLANKPIYIPASSSARRWFYDSNKNPVTYLNNSGNQAYTPTNSGYIRITINKTQISLDTYQVEQGSTATAYEPYQGETHTHQYSETIYGGVDDFVNGGLSVEWGYIAEYDGETLPGEWMSDRDEYAPGTTPTIGAQVVYKNTPTTISTSAEEITTIAGTNIISGTEPISECKYTELATVDDLIKIIGGQ